MNNQTGFSAIESLLVLVIVLLIGFIGYYVWHAQKVTDKTLNSTNRIADNQSNTVNSFAACVKAKSSVMEETYPEQCVTKDGKKFTGPRSQNGWEEVISKNGGFSVDVPDGWNVWNYGGGDEMRFDGITYTKGMPVKVQTAATPYAGDSEVPFSIAILTDSSSYVSPQGTKTAYPLDGLEGHEYVQHWTADTDRGPGERNKGDIDYAFVFNMQNGDQLTIGYAAKAGQTNQIDLIKQVIATIKLY
ncbi:MAG TPA: hypothetical protein VG992_04260 [Candidatus Saccharimonadales bacterium]|nr:hypothetical protein [Candidatus Saccharimonadales bacterium]